MIMTIKKFINCARCGLTHEMLDFKELAQPVLDPNITAREVALYTHWAPCPTNGEPILLVESQSVGEATATEPE
jgi:hypothetical protein